MRRVCEYDAIVKRIWTSCVVLAALSALPALAQTTTPAAAPATESSPSTEKQTVGALIGQLNDPDPQVRENATKALWSRGRPPIDPKLEKALKSAADSGPPEVKRRAKSILRDLHYGLFPDSPAEVFALLDQFRNGDIDNKRSALWMLNGMGTPGLRILMKLHEEANDAQTKQLISFVLTPRQHDVAVLMIAEGQLDAVEKMLTQAAAQAGTPSLAVQDYVAFLTLTGKAQAEFENQQKEPITPRNAALRLALARAVGNLDAARDAAEKISQREAIESVLVERGNWAALAERLQSAPQRIEATERLGLLGACYRLAGDEAKSREVAQQLVTMADQMPQNYLFCAKNLMLNSFPDEAEKVLLAHDDYMTASSYLASRLEFDKALELPQLALQRQPAEALKVKASSAQALHFIGKDDEAVQTLRDASKENHDRHDLIASLSLIDAAYEIGQRKLVDEFAADALATATMQDPVAAVFERMRLGDGEAATLWWRLLREDRPGESAARTLAVVRSIVEGTIGGDELSKLATTAEARIAKFPPPEREVWVQTIGQSLAAVSQTELATKWFDQLVALPASPAGLMRAGDYSASTGNWQQAVDRYTAACDRDPARPSAWMLRGWAMTKAGHAAEGAEFTRRAELIALGSEVARRELLESMKRHGLTDQFRAEIKLMLTVTQQRSYERSEALRDAAEQALETGDPTAATHYWDQAFLQNFSVNISFMEPWANVLVPSLVHKTRALGLISHGKIEAALKQAHATMQMTPADADAVIDIVNALDKANHHDEANAFYKEQADFYRKLVEKYPNSGSLHNQLAWAQVMSHRDLDQALKNAKRAVELEPDNTASIDTLAECYFANGSAKDAAAQMKKCVELEPSVPRHRKQLARFENATTQPAEKQGS